MALLNPTPIDNPEQTAVADTFRSATAAILTVNGDPGAAWKFEHCGESGLGWVGTCIDCGTEVYHPATCDLRVCPSCAYRRSAGMVDRLSPEIEKLVKHSPDAVRLRHIVLTTDYSLLDYIDFDPDYNLLDLDKIGELSAKIRRLRISIRLMLQERFPDSLSLGALIGTEFGPGGFRLHFHVLALCPFYPREELRADWSSWTEGHGQWVWIEEVTNAQEATENVVKYIVKEVAAPATGKAGNRALTRASEEAAQRVDALGLPCITAAIHFAFKGVRRVQTFGSFYGLGKEDALPCTCPACGGALIWETEVDWSLRTSASGDLFLKRVDNFSGPDPPTSGQLEQLTMFGAPVRYI